MPEFRVPWEIKVPKVRTSSFAFGAPQSNQPSLFDARTSFSSSAVPFGAHNLRQSWNLPIASAVEYVVSDRQDIPSVSCKNTISCTLLPGPTRTLIDSRFTCTTNVRQVYPGEEFELSLGVDPAIMATYPTLNKTTTSRGLLQTPQSNRYRQLIRLTNNKQVSMNVCATDQVLTTPVPEKVTITLEEAKNCFGTRYHINDLRWGC